MPTASGMGVQECALGVPGLRNSNLGTGPCGPVRLRLITSSLADSKASSEDFLAANAWKNLSEKIDAAASWHFVFQQMTVPIFRARSRRPSSDDSQPLRNTSFRVAACSANASAMHEAAGLSKPPPGVVKPRVLVNSSPVSVGAGASAWPANRKHRVRL